ncbi:MAG: hypothetical protein Q9196_001207 [Gyalolechia fulgens]
MAACNEHQTGAIAGHTSISEALELAVRFKKELYPKLNVEDQLFDHIFQFRDEHVYLCSADDTHFTIQPCELVLEHPGTVDAQDDSCYIQIRSRDKSTSPFHGFCSPLRKNAKAKDTEADFFLPLGWLVEHGKDGLYCPTRYVCLLNISTQPMSIWLVYDYVVRNEIDYDSDDESDSEIERRDTYAVYNDSVTGNGALELKKAVELLRGNDLILLYRDITSWAPNPTTCGSAEITEKHLLGPWTRAFTCAPPKCLLDDISQAPERH